jgi:hypothetical protein
MLIWSLGVCLFGHCVSFLSISYFDQMIVMWYWLLAVISVLSLPSLASVRKRTGVLSEMHADQTLAAGHAKLTTE